MTYTKVSSKSRTKVDLFGLKIFSLEKFLFKGNFLLPVGSRINLGITSFSNSIMDSLGFSSIEFLISILSSELLRELI